MKERANVRQRGTSHSDPDWLDNRLEVSGPDLDDFRTAASGPGFVDWQTDSYAIVEQTAACMILSGARRTAAQKAAHRLAERLCWMFENARSAAERGVHSTPLDLNVLLPVPLRIRRAGYTPLGAAWCRRHWGTASPLRRVELTIEQRRRLDDQGIDRVAVFTFASEDWSPWQALLAMRARWPRLTFVLTPIYDEMPLAEPERERHARYSMAPSERVSPPPPFGSSSPIWPESTVASGTRTEVHA
jgi:hypothetical protein